MEYPLPLRLPFAMRIHYLMCYRDQLGFLREALKHGTGRDARGSLRRRREPGLKVALRPKP
jgi:hypothetical protein